MKYMGSKARVAKHILPLILKDRYPMQNYVEPFCGGCNTMDKVTGSRIASDRNSYLISMWQALQSGWVPPESVSREHYSEVRDNYNRRGNVFPDYYTGFVGFAASYNGRFFDGGYAGCVVTKIGSVRDYFTEARNNILAQVPSLRPVQFV